MDLDTTKIKTKQKKNLKHTQQNYISLFSLVPCGSCNNRDPGSAWHWWNWITWSSGNTGQNWLTRSSRQARCPRASWSMWHVHLLRGLQPQGRALQQRPELLTHRQTIYEKHLNELHMISPLLIGIQENNYKGLKPILDEWPYTCSNTVKTMACREIQSRAYSVAFFLYGVC